MKHLFSLCLALASTTLLGQWTTNTALNTLAAQSATDDLMSKATLDGRTYIAFWSPVSAPVYYEMRVQLLDSAGVPQFGTNGLLVDNSIGMSTSTVTWDIAVDNNHNLYVGITGTGGNGDARVHKVSANGTKPWGTNGITVGQGYSVKLLPLNSGDLIVSYQPGTHAQIKKYNASGVSQWTTPITVTPTIASHSTVPGELVEISAGKFILVFHDKGGFSPSALPFAHCYSSAGAAVWTGPVAISSGTYTYTFNRYNLITRGDTAYFGYGGAQGMNLQSFIQRINPDGTLPWGANGVDFGVQNTLYERSMSLARGDDSKYLWAIAEMTTTSQGNMGEAVQKIHASTGARLLGSNGLTVFSIGTSDISHRGNLQVYDDHPVFLVSDGNSNGVFAQDLLLIELDSLGNFMHTPPGLALATNASGVKSRIHFLRMNGGKAIGAWAELRSGVSHPYAQMLDLTPCQAPLTQLQFQSNGLSVQWANNSLNADSVYWDFGDGNTLWSSASALNHTYSQAGTYQVCAVSVNSCASDTLCSLITLCAPLSAAFQTNTLMDSAFFWLSTTSADSVMWDYGDGVSETRTDSIASHLYAANGPYTVSAMAYDACTTDSATATVVIYGIGLDPAQISDWLLRFDGQVLSIQGPTHTGGLVSLQITQVDGRQMARFSAGQDAASLWKWEVSQIPPGMYILQGMDRQGKAFRSRWVRP
tara:strand:- start:1303 stop:3411 length:2109 start_codon:yes stop_codon:yes gene_type:complete